MRTKQTSKTIRTLRRRRLALALVAAMAAPAAFAQTSGCTECLPNYGQVVSGTATSNYDSGGVIRPGSDSATPTMTITQTTKGAIIDWGSFNIAYGYGVTFDQQFGASSVTLNRVVGYGSGATPSLIDGTLSANGSVFIINPAGITFTSGAQVNVGGLIASTLWMNQGDFINGLASGSYVFNGFNGDPSTSHQVRNNGDITVGAGGAGFVGPTLWNSGSITANGGNIGFGAGTAVTLDFVGDGLTQVTINVPPATDSAIIQDRYGSMTADGGKILLRTAATAGGAGGGIYASGILRAQTIANVNGRIELTSIGGPVMVGAPGVFSDVSNPYTTGSIDVSGGAGETGGSVLIQGNGVLLVNDDPTPANPADPFSVGSSIDASGAAGGGRVDILSSATVGLLGLSRINADSQAGLAGQVRIVAVNDVLGLGDISASSKNGNGGSVGVGSTTGNLLLMGNINAVGGINGGVVSLLAASGGLAIDGYVSASGGGGNGGQVTGIANNVVLTENSQISADGDLGVGGQVGFHATSALAAYGLLSAHGNTAGGRIITATQGTFDVRGLVVDAGSNGTAGSWLLDTPSLTVVNGSDVGGFNTPVLGNSVQDAEINYAFENGTSVVLQSGGDVQFDDAQILAAFSSPLFLHVNATGAIYGSSFSIGSSGGALEMLFNADSAGGNANGGYIDFSNASLASNGGLIAMYGQSDQAAGFATGYANGISLSGVDIDSGGGGVVLHGYSTGSGSGTGYAGVYLDGTNIYSGGGDVDIRGIGAGATSGVIASGGVVSSSGGDILVHGEGGTGNGVDIDAMIASAGGGITLYGHSNGAIGLAFGGYYGDISTSGGDIGLTGIGETGGVALHSYSPGSIDSEGGQFTVLGTAYGADAVGVHVDAISLISGVGDLTVAGSAPLGVGVLFANGAGVSTTSGAISLVGEGANFGLDLGDGALDTDSGDITLDGTALAATATAGVRMTGGGLTTSGGDISVTGSSAGGAGVQLGDGGAFAIGSGGGAITIEGTGIDAGVLMQGNQVASAGGAVSITGAGATTGVSLDGSDLDSAGGDIGIDGTASASGGTGVDLSDARMSSGAGNVAVLGNATAGTGVSFGGDAGITTTTGGISLTGIGADVGLVINGGQLVTDSGHFDLRGRGTGSASDGLVIGPNVSIVTDGGGIELSGEGGSGAGLSLSVGSLVDAGDSLVVLRAANDGSSDAIRLQGAIRSGAGVNLRPGGVDANGGLTERLADGISLGGSGVGFALSNAELVLIDTPELIIGSSLHAGAIQVLGAISRDGNLTLQNDGGSGGIDFQAALNVGNGTLALSSGGSISQTSAGAISAHSLLANAGGDVLLANAQNNVAATTLAGSAGGAFEFQDVDTLAIGNVSAIGFDSSSGGLSSLGANGIDAGGDVLVRNLAGDLILNADVQGANIDLVTAGRLQNPDGASLVASGDWRVWAATWDGETRGGLGGSGDLPNLYGCTFLGSCGVSVPGTDNHFIYVQQPTAFITFDDLSREYGLANPTFTFSVVGAILGDSAASVASGSAITTATILSDVGNYPISGIFTSAAGYQLQLVPGNLAVTPAMLFFTADSAVRYLGSANPAFSGTVTGFRNGDSIESVFGTGNIWSSPAGFFTPVGFYPVNGGTSAKNYVFAQAPGNATALQIIPLPQLSSTPIDLVRETVNTYVYDRNFGGAPVCAVNASIDDERIAATGDELSNEWAKVRSRPNLTNCFDTERKNGCSSF